MAARASKRLIAAAALAAMLVLWGGAASAAAAFQRDCPEPQFIVLVPGVAGESFGFSESDSCLPAGVSYSGAVISWGDGTVSAGTITGQTQQGEHVSVQVAGAHVYAQPGGYSIHITVTDDASGEAFEGGWHKDAHIVAAPEAPAGQRPAPKAPAPCPSPRSASLSLRRFAAHGARLTRGVIAAVRSDLRLTQLRARVHWGDGTSSLAALVPAPGGANVVAAHRWPRAGRYTVSVSLHTAAGCPLASVRRRFRVAT